MQRAQSIVASLYTVAYSAPGALEVRPCPPTPLHRHISRAHVRPFTRSSQLLQELLDPIDPEGSAVVWVHPVLEKFVGVPYHQLAGTLLHQVRAFGTGAGRAA